MSTITIPPSLLSGAALDWAFATACGRTIKFDPMGFRSSSQPGGYWVWEDFGPRSRQTVYQSIGTDYSPSTKADQIWPTIDQHRISLSAPAASSMQPDPSGLPAAQWQATIRGEQFDIVESGETSLIAAARCWVAFKLGTSIRVPAMLLQRPPQALAMAA